jgi:hypothetical protein
MGQKGVERSVSQIHAGLLIAFFASAAAGLIELRGIASDVHENQRKLVERGELIVDIVDRVARLEERVEKCQPRK